MMVHRICTALVLLFSVLVLWGLSASTAFAASTCDQTITDGAQFFKGDQSTVQVAAQKLGQIGADVRVFTVASLGSQPTLDDYIKQVQKGCASWLGPDGQRKNNLLIFAASLNPHKVGIYYGDRWVPVFDNGEDLRIQADFMAPEFRNGNFAKGFADGMNESYRIINTYLHPKSSGGGPTTVVNKKPADLTVLWIILGAVFGTGILLLVIFLGSSALRRRRKEGEEREAARQEALSNRDAATEILDGIGDADSPNEAARKAKVKKYSEAGADVAQKLQKALATLQAHRAEAQNGMASASSASGSAEDKGLPKSVYSQMARRYTAVLDHARTAKAADDEIDAACTDLDTQAHSMSQDVSAAQSDIEGLKGPLDKLRADGIHTDDIDSDVISATDELEKAKTNLDLPGLAHLAAARQSVEAAKAGLAALSEKRQQLHDGIPALGARVDQTEALIADGKACFDRISSAYAESSWKAVRGNGTEAEKRVQAAKQAMQKAVELSDVSTQEWDQALDILQKGSQLLDKAASLIKSITELEKNLHAAQENAPKEIEAAKADIGKARQYLHTYDDDTRDSLEHNLDEADKLLEQAAAELAQTKPDYLQVVQLATAANASADKIYAEAVSEHEAAERLRRQAASTLQQAEAAISQAGEYIQDHDSDVGNTADSYLTEARQEFQAAKAAGSAQAKLDHATNALDSANRAYSEAESDFEAAEDERRRRREAEEASIAASYSSSHSDDYGGGSSSSWGGGFGGGGSSISFGGGGGGGGSSSGW